ncbi:hypothetical protein LPJ59_000505 [Coemansia sp. RSA 2399]|nr:hypothetical protein LPJ59_000505 [Coemansia sp. RSA 2399]
MAGAFMRFWSGCAERQPLVTIALTNGAMGATGDVLAQCLFPASGPSNGPSNGSKFNPWRTVRFFAYGCMFGPVAFKWYSFLNRRFPFPNASTAAQRLSAHKPTSSAIIKRVAVDQIVFAPVAIAAFFTVMGAMEGKGAAEIRSSLRERYSKALVGNYMLWPWSQLINFGLVPLVYQVPFASLVSVVWNMYLSWVNSRRKAHGLAD